jgi:hypothetical protein
MNKKSLRILALAVSLSLFAPTLRAQEAPKPSPESKQLEVWVGKWTYQGQSETTPLGPAGKSTGTLTGRMVLKGFFLEIRWEEKDEKGAIAQGMNFHAFDPATKSYNDTFLDSFGGTATGTTVLNGNTWTSVGTHKVPDGKVYQKKHVLVFAQDRKSLTETAEYSSDDGKTWLPWYKCNLKKASK